MRWVLLIVVLMAIGVAMVHVRRSEIRARHEIRRQVAERVRLRRRLWDQQIRLSELTSARQVRRKVEAMALDLVDRTETIGPGVQAVERRSGARR